MVNVRNIRTYWAAVCFKSDKLISFDSFSVDHVPKEIKSFIGNQNIITNIFRIQVQDWIISGYVCVDWSYIEQ